jgi:hypothetical protein
VLVLTLLLGAWPAVRDAYPLLFHAHANALFRLLGAPELRLQTPSAADALRTDTLLRSRSPGAVVPAWTSWFSIVRIGFWPSAVLTALLLATPWPWRRRALAVALGLVLVDAWTLGRIGVEIAHASYTLAHGPGAPGFGALRVLLRAGSESLTATIPSAAFVLVAWAWLGRPSETLDLAGVRAWIARPASDAD